MVNDSLAVIVPSAAAVDRPSTTARRLVDASVSANTLRAYAGALGRLDGRWCTVRPGKAGQRGVTMR